MRILLIPAIALAFFAPTAHADLTGTTTTGFLSFYDHYTGDPNAYLRSTNYFSPTSATIGAGTEFIFLDALGTNPLSAAITADFTGTTLSIYTEWSNFLDHRFVFTDPSFTAITYLGSNPSWHASISGNTITIDVLTLPYFCDCNGQFNTNLNEIDTFSLVAAPPPPPPPPPPPVVPEPSTLLLVGSGALTAIAAARRKYLLR